MHTVVHFEVRGKTYSDLLDQVPPKMVELGVPKYRVTSMQVRPDYGIVYDGYTWDWLADVTVEVQDENNPSRRNRV